MNRWTDSLRSLDACAEAITWCNTQPSLKQAWQRCKRGDWMLWLLGRLVTSKPWSQDRKPLLLCALDVSRLALPYAGPCREEVEKEIEVLERWASSEKASPEKAKEARRRLYRIWSAAADAAYDAADAADAAAAADAADAAADAADAAYDAAADAAADADANWQAARAKALAKAATIVRRHYPTAPKIGAA